MRKCYNFQEYRNRDSYIKLTPETQKLKQSFIQCRKKNDACRPFKCKYCQYKIKENNENIELMIKVYRIFLIMVCDKDFEKKERYIKEIRNAGK